MYWIDYVLILSVILIVLIVVVCIQHAYRLYVYKSMTKLQPYNGEAEEKSYLRDHYEKISNIDHADAGMYYDKISYDIFEFDGMHSAVQIKDNPFGSGFDYDIFMSGIKDGDIVLDCGCGIGSLGAILLEKYPNIVYYALTNSEKQYSIVKTKFANYKNAFITLGDFDQLNTYYPNNYFDGIYFCETIGYSKNFESLLNSTKNIMKPGSWLYIRTVLLSKTNNEYIRSGQRKIIDYWRYDFSDSILYYLQKIQFENIQFNKILCSNLSLIYTPRYFYELLKFCCSQIKIHKYYDLHAILSHITLYGLIIKCYK